MKWEEEKGWMKRKDKKDKGEKQKRGWRIDREI